MTSAMTSAASQDLNPNDKYTCGTNAPRKWKLFI